MTPPDGGGGASDSPLHFTGQPRDPETGLDDFGARYNDSTLGRFMTPDWSDDPEPVPYAKLDNPQSLNLYSYVQNNPVTATDPDGHKLCGPFCERFFNWLRGQGWRTDAEVPLVTVTVRAYSPQQQANFLAMAGGIMAGAGEMEFAPAATSPEMSPEPPAATGEEPPAPDAQPEPSRGSTGRAEPANLNEQIAMKAAKSDPANGKRLDDVKMTDPRWPASDGWVKMSRNVNGVEIHYVYNVNTGITDDWKFK